jgi:hypothetical protein
LKVSDDPTLKVVSNQWKNGLEGLSYSELARVGLKRSASEAQRILE